jgi:hypothetical protein
MAWRSSGADGIFGEPVGERLGGGVLDVLGGVEVRFAGAEAHDVFPGGLHGLGLGINGQGEGRGQRGSTLRDVVVHKAGQEYRP